MLVLKLVSADLAPLQNNIKYIGSRASVTVKVLSTMLFSTITPTKQVHVYSLQLHGEKCCIYVCIYIGVGVYILNQLPAIVY